MTPVAIAIDRLSRSRAQPRRALLTQDSVEAVPTPATPGQRNYLWDTDLTGFGVMVTHAGTRSYLIQYKIGGRRGKTRRYSIGHHNNPWTVHEARAVAREKMRMVREGIDPHDERKARLHSLSVAKMSKHPLEASGGLA